MFIYPAFYWEGWCIWGAMWELNYLPKLFDIISLFQTIEHMLTYFIPWSTFLQWLCIPWQRSFPGWVDSKAQPFCLHQGCVYLDRDSQGELIQRHNHFASIWAVYTLTEIIPSVSWFKGTTILPPSGLWIPWQRSFPGWVDSKTQPFCLHQVCAFLDRDHSQGELIQRHNHFASIKAVYTLTEVIPRVSWFKGTTILPPSGLCLPWQRSFPVWVDSKAQPFCLHQGCVYLDRGHSQGELIQRHNHFASIWAVYALTEIIPSVSWFKGTTILPPSGLCTFSWMIIPRPWNKFKEKLQHLVDWVECK
jgi:hypothetical protein